MTFDVGTTAVKTCVFNRNLQLCAIRTDEYDLMAHNGMVEIAPEIYWQTMREALKQIGEELNLSDIQAICLTTQGETMIPVDKDGDPLCNAVVWLDDRAKDQAKEISKVISSEELYRLTGVTDMNGFVPLSKLLWFRQKRPSLYEQAYKFLLLEDYLLYRLTGEFVTEKSLLTSTAWYDIRNDRYMIELLEKLGLSQEKLPCILECGQLVGAATGQACADLGLSGNVQVFAGAMDQIAAAIGGGGLRDGVITATVGTAMVLTSVVPSLDDCTDPSLIIYRGAWEGSYVLLPLCNTAGAVFKWFKDQCSALDAAQCKETGEDVYDRLCDLASQSVPGANGVTMLPYFAGSLQPRLIPEAKGVFYGLELGTDHKTMTRAVLESIGYMLRENIEMLGNFGKRPEKVHFFGGGSKNPVWNQIIADITGMELVLLEQSECGSLGAAMLGAVSMGWFESIEQAQNSNTVSRTVLPNPATKEAYDDAYRRYLTLLEALLPIMKGDCLCENADCPVWGC